MLFQRCFVNVETTSINIRRLNFHFQPNFNVETTWVHRRWIDVILSTLFQRCFADIETTSINVRRLNFHFQRNINIETTLMNVDDQRCFNIDSTLMCLLGQPPPLLLLPGVVGNKTKGWISKRVFQDKKARQVFRETKISYPLTRIHTCAYQSVSNVLFFGNLAWFVFLNTRFEIRLFSLLPTMCSRKIKVSFQEIYHVKFMMVIISLQQKYFRKALRCSTVKTSMTQYHSFLVWTWIKLSITSIY